MKVMETITLAGMKFTRRTKEDYFSIGRISGDVIVPMPRGFRAYSPFGFATLGTRDTLEEAAELIRQDLLDRRDYINSLLNSGEIPNP